ncbi:MAG: MATE family efflux transporter [Clostridia bacterium]|nr:MATE family efflux transporter [Clostridia bacterium]
MITDMTEGKPSKTLWLFSMPMLLSVVFQQLYNIVDSVVAGKFIGSEALAAIGASYPVTMIFMAVAAGGNIGAAVVISQLFGAKKFSRMKTAVSTAIISMMCIALILTVLGLFFCPSMLRLLNTPENIFTGSALYLNIYTVGLVFLFLYNISTGVFTALGDSKTPLYFLIASSVGNIILDLVFVICFKMGISGVAWATFIAQGISSLMAAFVLMKRLREIKVERYIKFSWKMLKNISKIAVPSILQQSFVSVGNLFVQGRVNSFGSEVIGGYSAAVKLNTFAITSFSTLGNAVSSYTAQNIGAGRKYRIPEGLKAGMIIMLIIALPFFSAYFIIPEFMMNIFVDSSDASIIDVGKVFLRIVSPFYIVIGIKLIIDGILRGMGKMKQFMMSTFSDLILRVVLAYVFSYILDSSVGIWMSWPIGWSAAMIISTVCYIALYRKELCGNKKLTH